MNEIEGMHVLQPFEHLVDVLSNDLVGQSCWVSVQNL